LPVIGDHALLAALFVARLPFENIFAIRKKIIVQRFANSKSGRIFDLPNRN